MTETKAQASVPTIILIGGPFKADTGEQCDSRQAVNGDIWSNVYRNSLAASDLWWQIAVSVVMPLLDSLSDDSFAAVGGPRSTAEIKPDGTLSRRRLSNLLPRGVRPKNPEGKWQFVDMNELWRGSDWKVLVETWGWFWGNAMVAHNYHEFEASWFKRGTLAVIAPHTSAAQIYLDGYVEWVQGGRRRDMPGAPLPDFDWGASGLPAMVPVEADFCVTGLLQNGTWITPGPFESARRLLQARFDLKIGIWDLVTNDILRSTLLQELEGTAVSAEPAVKPKREVERELEKAANLSPEQRKQAERQDSVATAIANLLDGSGWICPERGPRGDFDPNNRFRRSLVIATAPDCFPAEAEMRHPSLLPGTPVVWVSFEISQLLLNNLEVKLALPVALGDGPSNPAWNFVFDHREVIEEIAKPYEGGVRSYLAGPVASHRLFAWQGDSVDCEEVIGAVAERGRSWSELFQPLAQLICEKIASDPQLGKSESS